MHVILWIHGRLGLSRVRPQALDGHCLIFFPFCEILRHWIDRWNSRKELIYVKCLWARSPVFQTHHVKGNVWGRPIVMRFKTTLSNVGTNLYLSIHPPPSPSPSLSPSTFTFTYPVTCQLVEATVFLSLRVNSCTDLFVHDPLPPSPSCLHVYGTHPNLCAC